MSAAVPLELVRRARAGIDLARGLGLVYVGATTVMHAIRALRPPAPVVDLPAVDELEPEPVAEDEATPAE